MRPGSVGGFLTLAGCLLLVVSAVIAATGSSIGVAARDPGGLVATAALALLAAGAVVIGLAGRAPFHGGLTRLGLGLLGVGLIGELATANVPSSSILVYVFLASGLVVATGVVVTAIALVRVPGRPRQIVLTILVGLLLAIASSIVKSVGVDVRDPAGTLLDLVASGLLVAGGALMILGVASVGVLGIRGTVLGPEPAQ